MAYASRNVIATRGTSTRTRRRGHETGSRKRSPPPGPCVRQHARRAVVAPTLSICVTARTMKARLPAMLTAATASLPEAPDPVQVHQEIQRLEHHRDEHEAGRLEKVSGDRPCRQILHRRVTISALQGWTTPVRMRFFADVCGCRESTDVLREAHVSECDTNTAAIFLELPKRKARPDQDRGEVRLLGEREPHPGP